jgi:hypothetical protein
MNVKFSETEYKNYGRCVCLDNGIIKLMATVDVGPRIIYFGLCGKENVLFEDTDRNFFMLNKDFGTWYVYGGHRIWCAPEVIPETYLPDNNKVDYTYKDGVLTLTPKATCLGKQFSLVCRMKDGNSVEIENRITNCTSKPMRFAPWSITSLTKGGIELIPLCRDDNGFLPNRTMALWSYSDIKDERFTLTDKYALLKQNPLSEKAFKVGFNVTDGYALYAVGNQLFHKSFGKYEKMTYSDFCCNFETYTNKHFLECELLGEEREYLPSETAVICESWEISAIDGSIEETIAKHINLI